VQVRFKLPNPEWENAEVYASTASDAETETNGIK
jgi:hypothetical protein